jgi:allantoin racemase
MARILWINPGVPPEGLNAELQRMLDGERLESTAVQVVSTGRGPKDLEFRYYEALVIPDVLHRIVRAEQEGYDGAVIGCFYDPGLEAAKEISSIAVTGPGEASMRLAAMLGHRFTIVIGRERWIPQIMENVTRYGMTSRLTSFRSIDMAVADMATDPVQTTERVREAARRAVAEDGADVIVLGCTRESGFSGLLQCELGVPVIDPVIAALKTAEHLAELRTRYGWSTSKIRGYEAPPRSQILDWDLGETFGASGLWEARDAQSSGGRCR